VDRKDKLGSFELSSVCMGLYGRITKEGPKIQSSNEVRDESQLVGRRNGKNKRLALGDEPQE
jgi:hypothetical protein